MIFANTHTDPSRMINDYLLDHLGCGIIDRHLSEDRVHIRIYEFLDISSCGYGVNPAFISERAVIRDESNIIEP